MKIGKIITFSTLALGLIGSQSLNANPIAAMMAALPALPQVSLPKVDLGVGQRVDNISESLDYAAYSIHYVGMYGAPAVNNLSKSVNNLVYNGIYKGIQSAGICATGVIAAACGLGIITSTILNDTAKNKKTKYALGAGLSALGVAAIMGSNWLAGIKN